MKKNYVLLLAVTVAFIAMSFKPVVKTQENLTAQKIGTTELYLHPVIGKVEQGKITIVAYVVVALAETSAAAVVVSVGAAWHWLFGNSESTAISNDVKPILQNVDMRNLDK